MKRQYSIFIYFSFNMNLELSYYIPSIHIVENIFYVENLRLQFYYQRPSICIQISGAYIGVIFKPSEWSYGREIHATDSRCIVILLI